nr:hypothetical protein [Aestuariimicrobium ganziense]
MSQALSFWMDPRLSPNVVSGGTGDTITAVQGAMNQMVLLAAVIGIVVAMAKMALTHRSKPGLEAVMMMFSTLVVAGLAATVVQLFIGWSDKFSAWMMQWSAERTKMPPAELFTMVPPQGMLGASVTTSIIVLIAGLAQVVFMLFRAAVIPVLLVMLPFTAATSSTAAGKQAFNRLLSSSISPRAYSSCERLVSSST